MVPSITAKFGQNKGNFFPYLCSVKLQPPGIGSAAETAGQVRDLQAGDEFSLKEKKTGKERRITLNKSAAKAIQDLLDTQNIADDHPLFFSQRGKVLIVPSVNRLVDTLVQGHQPQGQLRQSHSAQNF